MLSVSLNKTFPSFLQVLEFGNETLRGQFEHSLMDFLQSYEVTFTFNDAKLSEIYDVATTKQKRNAQLEKFFKTVFAEVITSVVGSNHVSGNFVYFGSFSP